MDLAKISQAGEDLINKYYPAYIDWLTRKLENYNSFGVLSFAVIAAFLLAIYVWFRNRS